MNIMISKENNLDQVLNFWEKYHLKGLEMAKTKKELEFYAELVHSTYLGFNDTARRPVKPEHFKNGILRLPYKDTFSITACITISGHKVFRTRKFKIIDRFTQIEALSNIKNVTKSSLNWEYKREGFASVDDFIQYWDSIYKDTPYDFKSDPLVWVIRFNLVDGGIVD